jgi:hypothetical protein
MVIRCKPFLKQSANTFAAINVLFGLLQALMLIFLSADFSKDAYKLSVSNLLFTSFIMGQLAFNFLFSAYEFFMMVKEAIDKKVSLNKSVSGQPEKTEEVKKTKRAKVRYIEDNIYFGVIAMKDT